MQDLSLSIYLFERLRNSIEFCLLAVVVWINIYSNFFVFLDFSFVHNYQKFVRFFLCSNIMSYLHLASTANSSSSSTPSSYLHVNSNGGVSTVPSASIGSNSPSIFGSVGGGKQWTTIGQPSSSSSSSAITQQLLKQQQQQHLLNNQQTNSLNSSSSSSHFDSLFGLTMASALQSSSQTQIEKNVRYSWFSFSFIRSFFCL